MEPLTPEEARDLTASILKRAIHGPTGTSDARWPGTVRPPIVVEPDQSFADWKELSDALVDEAGNEVLTLDPIHVYGVGILFPKLTERQEEELTEQQSEFQSTSASQQEEDEATPVPEVEQSGGEAEESIRVSSGGNRPRSLAMSFHLPTATTQLSVKLTGGRYTKLPVAVGGSAVDFWQRTPIVQEFTLDVTSPQSQTNSYEALTLAVGVDTHARTADGRLVTVYVANTGESEGDPTSRSLFQAQLVVTTPSVLPYPTKRDSGQDDASLDLLYKDHPVQVVGHGTDATAQFDETQSSWVLKTETVPTVTLPATTPDVADSHGVPYAIGMNDLAEMNHDAVHSVNRILNDYAAWITKQESELQKITDERLHQAAVTNLSACKDFLEDMRSGWQLVQSRNDVRTVLCWTSRAMNLQRRASMASTRPTTIVVEGKERAVTVEGTSPHAGQPGDQAAWRPFQIAFILAALPAAMDPTHAKRHDVDIIWMPTGGGKTEAYLGLAAFTILWERSKIIADGRKVVPSVNVLMRYTLRLLTAQQVQRASALMCALEMLRLQYPQELGDKPFRIGAYLGRAATPNTCKDAARLWGYMDKNPTKEVSDGGLLLTRCPWCAAQMGPVEGGVAGYRKVNSRRAKGGVRVQACCPDTSCPFSYSGNAAQPGGLPVLEVDEDIFNARPVFVVGTIDKFAQIAWRSDTRALFGLTATDGRVHRVAPAPSLFIQDELHLIAGPLGSLDALYEVALEHLCTYDNGHAPRIVAATATTKSYEQQVLRLYGRSNSRLVPPPALSIEDSFFSYVDHSKPAKTYVAVCAPGYGSNVQAQLRSLSALVHAGGTLDTLDANADPWWSNLVFFSSRRSLGLQLAACETGLRKSNYRLSQLSGLRIGREAESGNRHATRAVHTIKELTATSRDNVTQVLAQLDIPKDQKKSIDLCFATSMIEVGVDVPRLGLMTVMGQPKSYSQYIQVTGRVGRTDKSPGLVVVVLSPHAVRDRSHYETFTSTHQRLYASVEPVSITPFTPQALERGLAGAVSGALRNTHDLEDPTPLIKDNGLHVALGPWRDRIEAVGNTRGQITLNEEEARLARLAATARQDSPYLRWGDAGKETEHALLTPLGEANFDTSFKVWPIPLSMRSVDAETAVRVTRSAAIPEPRPSDAETNAQSHGDDDESDL